MYKEQLPLVQIDVYYPLGSASRLSLAGKSRMGFTDQEVEAWEKESGRSSILMRECYIMMSSPGWIIRFKTELIFFLWRMMSSVI